VQVGLINNIVSKDRSRLRESGGAVWGGLKGEDFPFRLLSSPILTPQNKYLKQRSAVADGYNTNGNQLGA